ncbi:hypothetical protein KVR01_004589 [Diaporthe batatas]|uniref:uncharacterized protein n=1 Tax=Diaporthe batatas TaxID=748121 RepID=UPI001D041DDF|nr:uncharacterized protein KVR01_004589 [Diaporthe batatas]KAG8166037.1 hypothetical protein KVR01_004589 [Diaporthe batatas]
MIRGAIVSMIFQKTLKLELEAIADSAPVTLMSTDIDGIHRGLQFLHDIWASLLAIAVGLYILQQLLGYSAFLVVVPSFICTTGAHFLSRSMAPAMANWNLAVQERVGASSLMLSQMKGIKMMGLTDFMIDSIQALRVYELDLSKRFRWIQSSVATVGGLGVARAFTALSIMALITEPLALLLASWPILRASVACFDRIQAFLLLEDHRAFGEYMEGSVPRTSNNGIGGTPSSPRRTVSAFRDVDLLPLPAGRIQRNSGPPNLVVVEMQNACFKLKNGNRVLHNIDIRVPRNQLTTIVGDVGSGKSSLLKAILGEIPQVSGTLHVGMESAAYCDQTTWLRNTSIRENIIGESSVDDAWYDRVTQACELHKDFMSLPSGDMTRVGSGGVSLSGGQRQRVWFGQFHYQPHIGESLGGNWPSSRNSGHIHRCYTYKYDFECSIYHLSRYMARTDTDMDAVKLAQMSDYVTILRGGRVQENQVRPESIGALMWRTAEDEGTATNDRQGVSNAPTISSDNQAQTNNVSRTADINTDEDVNVKRTGDKTLYFFYAKSIGASFCVTWLLLSLFYVAGSVAPQVWLRFWTQHDTNSHKSLYAGVYAAFSLFGVLGAGTAVGFFLVLIIPKSAQNLHMLLLKHVLAAPLYFFAETDSGTILNRFSQDMTQIDQVLPLAAVQTGFGALGVLAKLGLVASGASYVAAAFPFVFVALWVLQKCYLRTSRQIRHLDLECKAPLYTVFTETLSGLATLRAFAWQDLLTSKYFQLLDTSQKAYYLMFCLQRWLNVVLDMFTAGLAVLLVAIALNLPGSTSQGALGLAMVNLIDLNTSLNSLIMSWTNLEISLGALARLKSFIERTPSEIHNEGDCQGKPPSWPTAGEVVINSVTASYSPSSEPALRNVSLRIKPGQKVAICGRTGRWDSLEIEN